VERTDKFSRELHPGLHLCDYGLPNLFERQVMKSLKMLWKMVAEELATGCCTSTTRDWETVTRRFESEGLSFLTITLPNFGKDFEKSLDQGQVPRDLFAGWKTAKDSPVPLFLGGFLGLIFDRSSGRLLDKPDIDAIFAVRQLTLMYGKLLHPCSDARVEKAIEGYIECEKEIRRSDFERSSTLEEEFRQASLVLWGSVFQAVDEDVYYCRIVPRHGPGKTADRLVGNRKFDQREWTERLERVFPFGEYLIPNSRYHQEYLSRVHFLEPGAERPVRVVTVPKTLKTPRIIAIEPTCMQYVQQGLWRKFREYMESPFIKYPGNRNLGFQVAGFSEQAPNQRLAQSGSLSGELATLDLSEASDRVSNQLVRVMFERFPNLMEGVDACRSRSADVPGHGVKRLAKFASMGSALTFPVEALVFSTVCFMGIARALNRSVTPELIDEFRTKVRVYGDDIVVPVRFVHEVVRELEAFGFLVNKNKSFWTGKFRESCGKEFYDGSDVSIARVRRDLPTQLQHVEEIISTVSLRNQLYMLGLWRTAGWLDERLEGILRFFPVVAEESPVLGRTSVSFDYQIDRLHQSLHAPLVKGYVVNTKIPDSVLEGVGALTKVLLYQGEEPFADSDHLRRAGRPDAVSIKLGWRSPF